MIVVASSQEILLIFALAPVLRIPLPIGVPINPLERIFNPVGGVDTLFIGNHIGGYLSLQQWFKNLPVLLNLPGVDLFPGVSIFQPQCLKVCKKCVYNDFSV